MAEVNGKSATILAWLEMKIAECDREVEMAKLVGMEKVAAPFHRDARFFRATRDLLANGLAKAGDA